MEGCGGNTSRYRVSQMEVSDGMGGVQRTVYDHQNPWAWTSAGFPACNNFEFGGYSFVRSQVQDGTGTLYRVVENSYHQRNGNALDPRKGKVYQQVTKSSAGATLAQVGTCLLYTSDAADERSSVDLGGRRIIKKKKHQMTEAPA